MNRTGSNRSAGLSSNPALAAIQKAKAEAAAASGRSSLEHVRTTDAPPVLVSALSASPLKAAGSFSNASPKEAESETCLLREGWWAKTDAGGMNVIDTQEKKSANSYVPQALPTGFASTNTIKFERTPIAAPAEVKAPPAAPMAPEAAPVEAQSALTTLAQDLGSQLPASPAAKTESAVPAPAPAPLAAAPESGEFHWWDKMDNKVLNEKDTEAPKSATQFVQSSYQPQFMGSGLVNKLDFSRRSEDTAA